jgi:hypothetical protein
VLQRALSLARLTKQTIEDNVPELIKHVKFLVSVLQQVTLRVVIVIVHNMYCRIRSRCDSCTLMVTQQR